MLIELNWRNWIWFKILIKWLKENWVDLFMEGSVIRSETDLSSFNLLQFQLPIYRICHMFSFIWHTSSASHKAAHNFYRLWYKTPHKECCVQNLYMSKFVIDTAVYWWPKSWLYLFHINIIYLLNTCTLYIYLTYMYYSLCLFIWKINLLQF